MNATNRKQTKATVLQLRAEAAWDKLAGVLLAILHRRETQQHLLDATQPTFKLFGPNTSTSLLGYFFWSSGRWKKNH